MAWSTNEQSADAAIIIPSAFTKHCCRVKKNRHWSSVLVQSGKEEKCKKRRWNEAKIWEEDTWNKRLKAKTTTFRKRI